VSEGSRTPDLLDHNVIYRVVGTPHCPYFFGNIRRCHRGDINRKKIAKLFSAAPERINFTGSLCIGLDQLRETIHLIFGKLVIRISDQDVVTEF
jgi:hypothetical protein